MSSRAAFRRNLSLAGWVGESAWGYDEVYECYWAELSPGEGAPTVRVGPERLLVTLGGLAGAVAAVAGCPDQDAYLALTA